MHFFFGYKLINLSVAGLAKLIRDSPSGEVSYLWYLINFNLKTIYYRRLLMTLDKNNAFEHVITSSSDFLQYVLTRVDSNNWLKRVCVC